ncbi:AraC family transcriptional regulator [Aestuariirhabdus litorea]|uniref:AraC family transcriptional regulator n=1 Tax=Aestuariirhabdus litorea TaxID=2528527 RepID=A0A3P3VNC5_9GAMM|nr:AraC family transcriptional regulator [Aestuariirhabdus litorea]RRJ83209.1 AraC family transcriptional regulator [Aestuariirhabdus litorea]RWW93366.1 helix-turn-helix domain-containing protein [Endozoicomonadaceae bacterium GTF-13]
MSSVQRTRISILGLKPSLQVMVQRGYDPNRCLAGCGIEPAQLEEPDLQISRQQEFRFYRNLIDLSGDPRIGLLLGEAYPPQRYGLFGYAMLSAVTFGDAMELVDKFGILTFSHFDISIVQRDQLAAMEMRDSIGLDPDLLRLYSDRDVSAAALAVEEILGQRVPAREVYLMHNGGGDETLYRDYFGCPVRFSQKFNAYGFDPTLMARPLPLADRQNSQYFARQCQLLLDRLSSQSRLVDEIRQRVLATPGYFPDAEQMADLLAISPRTLRRRLSAEGSSYQEIIGEIRYELARQYLATSLPVEKIAELLGYSEPGNFTHAFKRWSGQAPSRFQP